jgi:transglutaminase-like putative cysteine protease
MLLDIRHETHHRYSTTARYSIQIMRLSPRTDAGQRVRNWKIDAPGRRWRQVDAFGNAVDAISVVEPHDEINVVAHGVVETAEERGQFLPEDSSVPPLAFALPTAITMPDEALAELGRETLGDIARTPPGRAEYERLMDSVCSRITYVRGSTDVYAKAAEAWALGSGVCQDMAHVFLAACRSAAVPARYVSGYVFDTHRPVSSHAWVEAWVADARRGAGAWLGFDVTHNRLGGPELCRVAVGRDYMDAGPIRGARLGGADEVMTVTVAVSAVG